MFSCYIHVDMYIEETSFTPKSGKVYRSVLLRESYRDGSKVRKRTIANLSNCSAEEIRAIKIALRHKHDLTNLDSLSSSLRCKEGLSVGAIWVVFQMAKRLGIVSALGNDRNGKLALWQVIARVLDQGSRLSAVRLARTHALASVIDLRKGFNEECLYRNLHWLSDNQAEIEKKLFNARPGSSANLFLYDVTSSYLEGQSNELAAWGYNRDGKRGKKQIVIGLLCDDEGCPVSVEVFRGNTTDPTTFASQIRKAASRFGCKNVTFIGDRGMIKSGQMEDLHKHGFHYITAITKKQIETLVRKEVFQLDLFNETICEIEYEMHRYLLRRNPIRAAEIERARKDKRDSIYAFVEKQNEYLKNHPRSKPEVALRRIEAKIVQLQINSWMSVTVEERKLSIDMNEEKLKKESVLDGCYAIKTDLPRDSVNAVTAHKRYKDLALVESAFRTCKTDLGVRPIFVQKEKSTFGHVLVVMLAYMIVRELEKAWSELDITVYEGLNSLFTLCVMEVSVKDGTSFQQIPKPREINRKLLEALNVELPKVLPMNEANVATKKTLARKP